MSIKHFTYLFTFLAFTSIVVLCLANFSFLFLHFFLQLKAAMKLLQKRKGYRGQPGLLSAARPATLRTSVLADMEAFF